MLKPNEIERFSMVLDPQMKQLEERIMADIVRRIRINGEITRAADWQITRLQQLGVSMEYVQNEIQRALGLSVEDIEKLYSDIIESGYARDNSLYEAVGVQQIPFEENAELQQLISSVATQTSETMTNITQSLGFATRDPSGKLTWSPLAQYYQNTLDGAMLDIASGAFDYNTVIKRVVNEMTNSGLRTIDYATGHKNRVDVAARRAIMTGMSQITAKVNSDNMDALGTEYVEVTWHGGARPSHQVWQGKIYHWRKGGEPKGVKLNYPDFVESTGYGTVQGLCGANCYHDFYPFVPGISEPNYTDEELKAMNDKENTPREFGGKQYTAYEAAQRQRQLETTMRAQREKIHLLEVGGADEQDIINARGQYRTTSAEYTRFSVAMDLPQQRDRVYVDGLGNIGRGKTKGAEEIDEIKPAPIGSKRGQKVTDKEREELLKQKR